MNAKTIQMKKQTDSSAVMFSDAWWVSMKKNWWKELLKLILITIIFWLIWMVITPLVNFKTWFSWWTHNGGHKLDSTVCFSMTSLAYWKYFRLYWLIGNTISGGPNALKYDSQAQVLLYIMENFANGKALNGILTPKALCVSIIPDSDPPQQLITLCGDKVFPHGKKEWPDPFDKNSWQTILNAWGAAGTCDPNVTSGAPGPPQCGTIDPGGAGDPKTWGLEPSDDGWLGNFLWSYNIPYDCDVVRAYMTGHANCGSFNLTYDGLDTLLGTQARSNQAGGFWGYLQLVADPDMSQSDYSISLWASITDIHVPGASSTAGKCSSGDQISAWTTGAGAAINIVAFLAAASPLGAIFAAIAAGATAIAGSAATSGCSASQLFGGT